MSWTPISKAYVFALLGPEPEPVGVVALSANGAKFRYADSWLASINAFPIDPVNLPLTEQTFVLRKVPRVLMDATPDEWGRRVMTAKHYRDPARQIPSNDIEWMLATQGNGAGCLLFSASRSKLVSPTVPTFNELTELADAIDEIDQRKEPTDQRVLKALQYGSSMGGARPKVTVLAGDNEEWIVKFGRKGELFDNPGAEHACLSMAEAMGIRTAGHVMEVVSGRNVVMIKRFDRDPGGHRKHFISALSLLSMRYPKVRNRDYAEGASYMGIAEVLRKFSSCPAEDMRELFTRMALNVVIGNTDDHMRNHGMLYEPGAGWRLAPAYDIVPQPNALDAQAIGIGLHGRESTLGNALSCAGQFGLCEHEARIIVDRAIAIAQEWPRYGADARMEPADIALMQRVSEQVCQRTFAD